MSNIGRKIGDIASDKNFRTLIPTYLNAEVIGMRAPLTAQAKRQDLAKFVIHYEAMNGHDLAKDWMPRDTTAFLDALKKQGYSPATVNRCLATLRAFGKWLQEVGIVSQHPCRGIRDLQLEQARPKAIRDLAFHRLRKAADVLAAHKPTKYSQGVRDRAIMEALNASGLRISELLSLKLNQFVGRKFVNVICKGGRVRDVLITIETARLIDDYVANHRLSDSDYLFTNRYGQKISRNGVANALRRIAGYASLTLPPSEQIELRPHLLRHRHGFKAREAKDDTFAVKRLGHSSSRYVERYTGLDDAEESALIEKM